jgi:hypothetical protein
LEQDLGALGQPLEGRRAVVGLLNSTISTLSNWWTRRMPRVSFRRRPPPPEARRVGRAADRQVGRLEDLVAVRLVTGTSDVGSGTVVAGDDVHLVFLVRDLARPRAEAVFTTTGGQISVKPCSRWTSRNHEISARWSREPAPL